MKTIFIITGFRFNVTATDTGYKPLRDQLTAKGYKVVPVDINWKHKTIGQFCDQFIQIYNSKCTEHNLVLGNSFGAMVAFITTPILKPDAIILGSLSPFFKEDLSKYKHKTLLNRFGKKRLGDLETHSANKIADQINKLNVKSTFVYGELEKKALTELMQRVLDSAKKVKGSQLIELANAPYSMRDPTYIEELLKVIPSA